MQHAAVCRLPTCRCGHFIISLPTGPKCSQLTLHLNVYTSVGGKVLPSLPPQMHIQKSSMCARVLWLLLRVTKVLLLAWSNCSSFGNKEFLSFTKPTKYAHKQIYFHYDRTHIHTLSHTHSVSHTHTHTRISWPNCNCAYLMPSRSVADVSERRLTQHFDLCFLVYLLS